MTEEKVETESYNYKNMVSDNTKKEMLTPEEMKEHGLIKDKIKKEKAKIITEEELKKYDVINKDILGIINPETPYSIEKKKTYAIARLEMYKHQIDFVESIRKYLGFNNKSEFVKYCVLMHCLEQKKIYDVKCEADIDFAVKYKPWRRSYLIKRNNIKKKIEELKEMAPGQDDGGDPFDIDDLME